MQNYVINCPTEWFVKVEISLAFEGFGEGTKEAAAVKREAEMLHVFAVEFGFFLFGDVVATVDLCPAGETRADVVSVDFITKFY